MLIRKLEKKERFDAALISAYCFHFRIENPEERREEQENLTVEDWGAFAEDGTLMAHIINNEYQFYLDGTLVKTGGIGAVSTLPEYRESGAVRAIFKELLKESYKNGQVISTLYPFNHAFYRKQGYDTVTFKNVYDIRPDLLTGYKFDGTVKRYNPGEDAESYAGVYNAFAKNYNFAMPRDEKAMQEHLKTEHLYSDRKFSYLLSKDGEDIAYITFIDIKDSQGAILQVDECAWVNRNGFYAILAFLGKFDADYRMIQLPLPAGIDLLRIIRTTKAYDIHKNCKQDFMVRVINAEELLRVIKKPDDCDFIIQVTDDLIEENNRVWQVTKNEVKLTEQQPDLTVNERTLGQMATGCINLDEAMLKPDIEVSGKEEMLRRVFVEKKIFVGEHF